MPQFAALMALVCELYKASMSQNLMEFYWQALRDTDFIHVERAFKQHMCEPKKKNFMPKPSDILYILEGDSQNRAMAAWTKVEKAIGRAGQYNSVVFDDAVIHAVIDDMGGWIRLCNTKILDLPFRAQDFERRYMNYLNRLPEKHPAYLPGIFESNNANYKIDKSRLIFIGNIQRANKVLEQGSKLSLMYQEKRGN